MTTSQLEHLRLLDAHLDRLLKTAGKRTPGEWQKASRVETSDIIGKDEVCGGVYIASVSRIAWGEMDSEHGDANAAFIASCAGNAEAGWRSTKASVALLLLLKRGSFSPNTEATNLLNEILAAWPLGLITKHP